MNTTQHDLFGCVVNMPHPIPIAPERFALGERIATVMSRAIRSSGIDRTSIAARISALTGKRTTLSVLNAQTAISRPEHSPSLLHAMAFDAVTGEWSLLKFYADAAGAQVIFGDDIIALELGRVVQARQALRRRDSYLKKIS